MSPAQPIDKEYAPIRNGSLRLVQRDALAQGVMISVIIPTYNMGFVVDDAIQSVLANDFQAFEILCVDDGSKDDTGAVVQKYTHASSPTYDPRIRYFYQDNRGKAAAVNTGLQHACGTYLTVLDADDMLPPDSLSKRYHAVTQLPTDTAGSKLVIGSFSVSDGHTTQGVRHLDTSATRRDLIRQFFLGLKYPFHMNSCLVSRDLISQTGGFDIRLRRAQDADFSLRSLKQADHVVLLDDIVYTYRKYRASRRDRVIFRLRTMHGRARMYWKNYEGMFKPLIIARGVLLDSAKMIYELTGNYTR